VTSVLNGVHALVTGAGRGIGAAIVTTLAESGARLTLLGRNRTVLDTHAATLGSSAEAFVVTADVTDEDAVTAAFAAARARHGEIAILVNNAGAATSAPFTKLDRTTWDAAIAVNLTATYVCCRTVVGPMIAARYGRIVNVASTAGLAGGPYIAAYTAAKHGAIGLTRSLAAELGSKGITVNAVCPGFTETAMLDDTLARIAKATGRSEADAAKALLARNPLGRFVRPDEVAGVVAWLCRPDSAAINGQAIVVDGGEVAR
jgi:NAD(P)-dependent dehydrogenase (short-subunit alcohol dehydrogenase family)